MKRAPMRALFCSSLALKPSSETALWTDFTAISSLRNERKVSFTERAFFFCAVGVVSGFEKFPASHIDDDKP